LNGDPFTGMNFEACHRFSRFIAVSAVANDVTWCAIGTPG
jgi:hypothetical protein